MRFLPLLALLCAFLTAAEPFRITVNTDIYGWSDDQFTLPLKPDETYDCTVDWGDGTSQVITTSDSPTHTYPEAGSYTISITENSPGGFPAIYFDDCYDASKLTHLVAWGDVHWATFSHAFSGCSNLVITATDHATAQTGGVSDFSYAWSHCNSLTSFPLINTAAGINFSNAWSHCYRLTSFPLINTAAGADFSFAWWSCWSLTSFPLINTAAGTDFSYAWWDCSGLTSFPLINTAAGTSFSKAWGGCSNLASFPLINTAAGTNFSSAWEWCSGLTSFPLINTAKGTNFSSAWEWCSGLTSFPNAVNLARSV